ncbi:hypothetical protein DFH07DRAFT_779466 [Mycena maculata]|uniref:Uncharacterized protein n=1 Tax=Mycena maculata TaxID=230809 RepID=A0AAD7I8J6_9AGAR|nr:hypothetical protein DFH07DRAFT_779466 [Mycena maculata]
MAESVAQTTSFHYSFSSTQIATFDQAEFSAGCIDSGLTFNNPKCVAEMHTFHTAESVQCWDHISVFLGKDGPEDSVRLEGNLVTSFVSVGHTRGTGPTLLHGMPPPWMADFENHGRPYPIALWTSVVELIQELGVQSGSTTIFFSLWFSSYLRRTTRMTWRSKCGKPGQWPRFAFNPADYAGRREEPLESIWAKRDGPGAFNAA